MICLLFNKQQENTILEISSIGLYLNMEGKKMAFNVIKDGMDRYQINIGVGRKFRATTIKEVSIALEHYFERSIHWRKKLPLKNCPLCEKVLK